MVLLVKVFKGEEISLARYLSVTFNWTENGHKTEYLTAIINLNILLYIQFALYFIIPDAKNCGYLHLVIGIAKLFYIYNHKQLKKLN
jgi:hypothetical protein